MKGKISRIELIDKIIRLAKLPERKPTDRIGFFSRAQLLELNARLELLTYEKGTLKRKAN